MSRKRAGAYLSVLAALKERNYNAKSETNRKRMGGGEGGKWGRVWRGGEVVGGGEERRLKGGEEAERGSREETDTLQMRRSKLSTET